MVRSVSWLSVELDDEVGRSVTWLCVELDDGVGGNGWAGVEWTDSGDGGRGNVSARNSSSGTSSSAPAYDCCKLRPSVELPCGHWSWVRPGFVSESLGLVEPFPLRLSCSVSIDDSFWVSEHAIAARPCGGFP